jgi:hypothetical protein
MERIIVDLQTNTTTIVPLTQDEIAQAMAQKAAWENEQSLIQPKPSLESLIQEQQAMILELKAEVAALKGA